MDNLDERLERLFQELMPRETVLPRERTRLNCVGWDSLLQLNLLVAIEQEFGIRISDDEAIDLNSYAMARHLVSAKAAGPSREHGEDLSVRS